MLMRYLGDLHELWKSKRKHFLILSSAGKPIYNRHGDDNLISGYIGVIQTIISFYEGAHNQLKGFTAANARFVIMSQGPLYLVAISKLGESDTQLRVQLEALYMQILSTLTLPTLTHLFSNRPSTDLRRPLKGTERLLSALADTFTRGSPPTLLSALECLKIRKSHRQVINDTLLQTRCDGLLYGLIVAGGRLVSVVRPRKHSLHPNDLQLIFNMLFEADGIKAGGGENWIPLCLPGFNKNGYLYMYVSFIDFDRTEMEEDHERRNETGRHDEVAVLLISANKESFYDLRKMRDAVVDVCHHLPFPDDYSSLTLAPGTRSKRQHGHHQIRSAARPPHSHRHRPRNSTAALPLQITRQRPIHHALLRTPFHNLTSTSKVDTHSTLT